jgi:DegV family protein with EDD domain
VVVDSSSCLPPELLAKWHITSVPHQLIVGQRTHLDGVDIWPGRFYRLLHEKHQSAFTTAAPQPQHFLDAFLEAGQRAPNVLCLTLSANFSATYRSACAAVAMAAGRLSGVRVEVVDSQTAAGGLGLIALAAARWSAMGHSFEQVIGDVHHLAPRVNLFAFLDTLRYLSRGGRARKLGAWAGTLLRIKPLTELRLGEARMVGRPRSRAKATAGLLDLMRERVGRKPVVVPLVVNVMEAGAPDDAAALALRIEAEFSCRELFVSQFTPVMGLHTGPGLLGVAFYLDDGDGRLPHEA